MTIRYQITLVSQYQNTLMAKQSVYEGTGCALAGLVYFSTVPTTAEIYAMIESRRTELGLSQAELGKLAFDRADSSAIQNLRRGSSPTFEKLEALARALNLDLYLGPPRASGSVEHVVVDGADYAAIALHDAALSAGPGVDNSGNNALDRMVFRRDWLKREGIEPGRASLAYVVGESMLPTLTARDVVLINEAQKDLPKRCRAPHDRRRPSIYAFVENGEARIKRIDRLDADTLVLISDNPEYPPEIRTSNQFERFQTNVIGKVAWWGHTNRE